MHRDPEHWQNEVHAYERWAPAFGEHAPRLIAVREQEPLALLIRELPGELMEHAQLTIPQQRAAWRSAGQALAAFHVCAQGEFFGPVRRDGRCAGMRIQDAAAYLTAEMDDWLQRGARGNYLNGGELAVLDDARSLLPAFAGEQPIPCHRDYSPANWLVTESGAWAGVIDFEFAFWDVRAADFTRYPGWEWIDRPDLIDAFFTGYGRAFTAREEKQRLFSHALYALGAIVWGEENGYLVFAGEGRRALRQIAGLLG
jgi:Ser/Thr protein kinase RdoA (MazF antagonist)